MPRRLRLDTAAFTRIGARARNEDAHGWRVESGFGCAVIADGAGGHGGGEVAARLAVDAVLAAFARHPGGAVEAVPILVDEANRAVLDGQRGGPALGDMRATLVVLALDPARALARWAHVGDSRLYALRAGALAARTRDHSLAQALADAGLSDGQRPDAPGRGVLTASLGGPEAAEARVSAPIALQPGDAFLLCTDGLWERLSEADLLRARSGADSAREWLDRIGSIADPAGDRDNATALAVVCGDWVEEGASARAVAARAP